ncbi:protein-disulfide reductase DsbD family protein [Xanthocytophaga agilis]|uniref:Cytochrome c biogenesis protein CcdA n=1 Tax=Xanthocytophaga agilis TaxID=3048010 RepID=A0AAE3R4H3_9BACT|nr:cytochrome c biogenesis protein CcdA [Xanthocytophaga agilis]MDJ1503741.1 cytochrome c biogenesis protein CcdA [Xanthocytophaga agilis]
MKPRFLLFFFLVAYGWCQAQIERPVTWEFTAKATSAQEATLTFTATIKEGWHVYSQFIEDGGPVPTSFTFTPSKDYQLVGKVEEKSTPIKAFDKTFNMNITWFANKAVFTQKVKLSKATKVQGSLEFMVCDDTKCLPPDQVEFAIAVEPLKGTSDEKTADTKVTTETTTNAVAKQAEPKAPEKNTVAESQTDTGAVVTTESTNGGASTSEEVVESQPVQQTPVATVGAPQEQSLWITFVAGLLGGFAAILMPCIFPLLPLTVSFFTKQSGSRAKGIRMSMLYGISIIVIYVSLGLLITVLFGADALNDLSTNGIFNFFFFVLLVVFAASFLGAFEIVLPSSWVNKADMQSEKGGLLGIFFMAATLALVSFSCTGPIIGTLLVQAASMGQLLGPAVGMFGFAFALALPFTLFSLFPSWLTSLPKAGSWLNTVKVVLGFLELALALKFLSNVDLAYHWEWFDREVFLVLWIVIFGLLGLYLLGKLKLSHDGEQTGISAVRLFLAVVTLAFSLYMIPGLWGAPLKVIAAFLPPQHTQDFDLYTNSLGGGSQPSVASHAPRKYSEIFHAPLKLDAFFDYDEGMAYARQVNKPVIIDFTGHACVNCRKMEATVWPDMAVLGRLREKYVLIQLYVDDKTELPANEQYVSKFSGKKVKTIGNKWSDMQATRFNANSQPYYVLLDAQEQVLVTPQGANYDVTNFINFLDLGLKNYSEKKIASLK